MIWYNVYRISTYKKVRSDMLSAKQAKEKTALGVLNELERLIEQVAEKGLSHIDLEDYDVKLTDDMINSLKEQGYNVDQHSISW